MNTWSTIELAGLGVQLISVLAAGLALPDAKPIRNFIQRNRYRAEIALWIVYAVIYYVLYAFVIDIDSVPLWVYTPLTMAATFTITVLAAVIPRVPEDRLRRVLELMAAVFGFGIILEIVAVIGSS